MTITLESLPVELVTAILEELDLASLIVVSYLSRRLHTIASDRSLNPWRAPILRNLHSGAYEDSLKHLSVRTTVPRQNWIEIISMAQPPFLLFDATLPNMKEADWHECFKRRFLPGWQKWKRDSSWKETFKKCVYVDTYYTMATHTPMAQAVIQGLAPKYHYLHSRRIVDKVRELETYVSHPILRCRPDTSY
jgi:hypothetical protein